MNGLYDMLLFLFILGAATQGFNELGIFNMVAPDPGLAVPNETNVVELQNSAAETGIDDFNYVQLLLSFGRVIGMGFLSMFLIIPTAVQWMTAVGLNLVIAGVLAGILQIPITYVTVFGLYELWTGRSLS